MLPACLITSSGSGPPSRFSLTALTIPPFAKAFANTFAHWSFQGCTASFRKVFHHVEFWPKNDHPLFAATTGPDAVFPAHSGNPNASVDLDHSMPRYRAGFLVANPRREFSLSCAIAARDNSGIAVRKAESMYCLIVRLWDGKPSGFWPVSMALCRPRPPPIRRPERRTSPRWSGRRAGFRERLWAALPGLHGVPVWPPDE